MALTTITNPMVAVNAIQGTLIADNAITAVHIATNAVSGTLIADNAVTAVHIAQNTITVTQIADDAIEAAKIADGVITTNHLNKAMISSQTEVTAVGGDYVLIGDTSDSNNLKKALVSDFGNDLDAAVTINESGASVDFRVESNTNANMLFVDGSADKVGIGTSSPASALHISGGDNTAAKLTITNTANTNTYSIHAQNNAQTLHFQEDGTNVMSLATGGKLGIGETSPAATLHVEHSSGTAYNGAAEVTESLIVSNKAGTDDSGVNNVASIGLHVADGATSQGFINYVRSANNQGYFTLSQRTASTTYEEQFSIDREGQTFIKGTSPYMQIRDTTAGGGAGNGGQVIFSGHHASSSDGFREFAKIVGVKANSTGGDTHGYLGFYTNEGAASPTENMRLDEDGELIVGTSVLGDTYNPLVTGVTSDALVAGRHATSGSLGIWRTNTMEFKVYHNGQGYIMTWGSNGVISGDFNDTSDVNLKENISTIADGTTVINSLRPVKFDWKDANKGNNQHGFIAQEVETVLPYAVEGNDYVENETGLPDDEPANNGKTMNSNAVLAHAVKAIQEQQTIIDDLKSRIEALEG